MAGFVYDNSRPAELVYTIDAGATYEPTGFIISDLEDIAQASRLVRARAFGSLTYDQFYIRSWVNPGAYLADSNEANMPSLRAMYNYSGKYLNLGASSLTLLREVF